MGGAFLLSLALAAGAPANVVVDGGFEQPGLQIPRAGAVVEAGRWVGYIHGQSDAAFAITDDAGRDGTRCVRYRRTQAGSDNVHLDQVVPLRKDTLYEVSAWMRTEGKLNPILAVMTMRWGVLAQTTANAGAEWRQVRLLFHSYDNEQVRLEWFPGAEGRLYTGAPGTSWLDDVSVRPLDPVPPEVTRAFDLSRPKAGDEMDLSAVRPGPVGHPKAIRPITCRDGVLRYDDGSEVALWGTNLQTALSWEYNGRLKPLEVPLEAEALKRITDDNLEQLRFLGAGVVRLHLLPSDFSDAEGNLRDSVYLDVLDYLIARCNEAGIYVYLTLVNEMSTRHFADSFLLERERREWLFDPVFVGKTERYITQLLRHENRYTHRAYAADPTLGVIEVMNEPDYLDYSSLIAEEKLAPYRVAFERWMAERGVAEYPEAAFRTWRHQVVRGYLDRMCAAIRSTGARQPIAWNLNWPRMINGHEEVFQAAADSPVDAVSFCLYPGQGDVPHPYWDHPMDLSGRNYLPFLRDHYREYDRLRWILGKRFAAKAKLVYEFETFYNQSGYLYPAMARLMRSLGVQMAQMWQYSLTPVAEYVGGSHYLNALCTPEKAASFAIAGRVFARSPRYAPYDTAATEEMAFDGCFLSFPRNISVLRSADTFMQSRDGGQGASDAVGLQGSEVRGASGGAGWTSLAGIRHILGCGNSPLVSYDGTGLYRVDVGKKGVEIRILPDAAFVRPPWERGKRPSAKLCVLNPEARHRFALHLPGWRGPFAVYRVEGERLAPVANAGATPDFEVTPGRYRIVRR